jgi:hypothetical protein
MRTWSIQRVPLMSLSKRSPRMGRKIVANEPFPSTVRRLLRSVRHREPNGGRLYTPIHRSRLFAVDFISIHGIPPSHG